MKREEIQKKMARIVIPGHYRLRIRDGNIDWPFTKKGYVVITRTRDSLKFWGQRVGIRR